MALNFESVIPTRIIFGNGALGKVPELVAKMGNRVLIVTGASGRYSGELTNKLDQSGFFSKTFCVCNEPETTDIESAVLLVHKHNCNVIVGIGGGSAVDAAKAIAALSTNRGNIYEYLEVIGDGKALNADPLPVIAIPTTAGTGAEVTKNAVIKSKKFNVKVSLRSEKMFPVFAVIDPLLTVDLSPQTTAYTAIDALTHLIETFVSSQANPFIDMICSDGIQRIAKFTERAYYHGNDIEARENLAFAAMLGGMALSNAKLGAVHGFAGPLGGAFHAPHGAVCACLLPAVMEVNIDAVHKKLEAGTAAKFNQIARWLTNNNKSQAEDGVVWIRDLIKKLKIPGLSSFGVQNADFQELIEKAKKASSMKGNPVVLNDGQLLQILEKSMVL